MEGKVLMSQKELRRVRLPGAPGARYHQTRLRTWVGRPQDARPRCRPRTVVAENDKAPRARTGPRRTSPMSGVPSHLNTALILPQVDGSAGVIGPQLR
jgi:hypothetical protein